MSDEQRMMDIFMDIQSGLPRQGPGLDDVTLKALELCTGLPSPVKVLDLGCGPGKQTLALASALDCHITAVDLYQPFLDQLKASASAEGLSDKITVAAKDMGNLPYDEQTFDLIWAEASAYSIGFKHALATWKPLLKEEGYIVVSELVWLDRNPPAEASSFWAEEYPDMQHIDDAQADITDTGYIFIDRLRLPDEGWWTHYYTPLSQKLPDLRAKYAGDAQALALVSATEAEINMRRTYPELYGYVFFIGRHFE